MWNDEIRFIGSDIVVRLLQVIRWRFQSLIDVVFIVMFRPSCSVVSYTVQAFNGNRCVGRRVGGIEIVTEIKIKFVILLNGRPSSEKVPRGLRWNRKFCHQIRAYHFNVRTFLHRLKLWQISFRFHLNINIARELRNRFQWHEFDEASLTSVWIVVERFGIE